MTFLLKCMANNQITNIVYISCTLCQVCKWQVFHTRKILQSHWPQSCHCCHPHLLHSPRPCPHPCPHPHPFHLTLFCNVLVILRHLIQGRILHLIDISFIITGSQLVINWLMCMSSWVYSIMTHTNLCIPCKHVLVSKTDFVSLSMWCKYNWAQTHMFT